VVIGFALLARKIDRGDKVKRENSNDDLLERVRTLEELLREATDDLEDWASYAPEYFKKKHNLAGDLAKYRAARAPTAKGTVQHAKNCAFVIDSGYRIPSPCTCGATDTQGAAP
jgi:hypothetical protein